MKKLVLLAVACISMTQVSAQITLESQTHTPLTGSSYGYMHYSPSPIPNFTFAAGGANKVWDLSSVPSSYVDLSYTYNGINNSEAEADYPNAIQYIDFDHVSIEGERYINSDFYGMYNVGYKNNNEQVIYSDQRKDLTFPMTYGDSFTDSFNGTVEIFLQGTPFDRIGNQTVVVDGFGSLILPYKTINNVLRIKITGNYEDSLGGIPIGEGEEDLAYLWYGLDAAVPLAFYKRNDGLCYNSTYLSIIKESDLAVNNDRYIRPTFLLSPNPASDFVTINTSKPIEELVIYDVCANKVKDLAALQTKKQIDVSDLPAGMYYVKYIVNGLDYMDKLVIM